jgi:membrane protein YqaA with SNARE-associated domain
VTESLLSTFGLYGGAFVIAFVAGLFPLISIELFLVGISTWATPTPAGIALLIVLSAIGHQLAKTVTFYAGIGALENKKLAARVEKVRSRIDRWNKRPKLIMFLSATVGLPPLWLLGFIAHPLMKMRIWPFTLITFFGRVGRYAFMMIVPLLVA